MANCDSNEWMHQQENMCTYFNWQHLIELTPRSKNRKIELTSLAQCNDQRNLWAHDDVTLALVNENKKKLARFFNAIRATRLTLAVALRWIDSDQSYWLAAIPQPRLPNRVRQPLSRTNPQMPRTTVPETSCVTLSMHDYSSIRVLQPRSRTITRKYRREQPRDKLRNPIKTKKGFCNPIRGLYPQMPQRTATRQVA